LGVPVVAKSIGTVNAHRNHSICYAATAGFLYDLNATGLLRACVSSRWARLVRVA
jgi:hypothetical protein